MRLGGPLFDDVKDPEQWVEALQKKGYRAAYCPVQPDDDGDLIDAYAEAAKKADIVIAETGAWSSPVSEDDKARKAALKLNKDQLALAERIGARCCVNVAGGRGTNWLAPDPRDMTEETFDMIVEVVREIIDEVRPTRTFYTLETMPYTYPDTVDCYVRFVKAIDRKQFACHFDPVNLISSPQLYYSNAEVIRDFCNKLGPYIRSCHAKDTQLMNELTVFLKEVIPGTGALCYRTYLTELSKLDPDIPVMLEHLETEEEYDQAASYVRLVAEETGETL